MGVREGVGSCVLVEIGIRAGRRFMKFLCELGGIPIRPRHLLECGWRLRLSELGALGARCGYADVFNA